MAKTTLRPNAAGEYATADYQFPNSDEHWDKADEAVADDNDTYVYTDTSAFWKYELYNLDNLSGTVGSILGIKVYARCKESEDGAIAEIWVGTNGDYAYSDDIDLTSSWANYSKSWATNPVTGVAWTEADINALQAGVLLKGYAGSPPVIPASYSCCTQVYVEVTHSSIFPTKGTTRVTSIIHRYDRGVYNMELGFGDVTADFGIPEMGLVPKKAYESTEEKEEEIKEIIRQTTPSPAPQVIQPTTKTPTQVTPTKPAELTQYAKDILATPAGQAAQARQQGLTQGVEAVVTPYAIRALKKNEEAAKILTEIQRLSKAQSAPAGIMTDYARGVLTKKIAQLRADLDAIYKRK